VDGADEITSAKQRWRRELSAARLARPRTSLEAARAEIVNRVVERLRGVGCVAAYEPLRTEPGSVGLLTALHAAGSRVLVPRTLADRDLDWVPWSPSGPGEALGLEAIATADAVLVPALAVARDGTRLGRGGGSYDRALPRRRPDAVLAAIVFTDELVQSLPHAPWDVRVAAAVTPAGWVELDGNADFPTER
jgi:5-formyltetrahydrofolate cyclo-ligase